MPGDFRPRRLPDPGSGGKIVRGRNLARAGSPYFRPPPPPPLSESPPRSPTPGWLFSAARTLAAGAGKLISVFRPDDSSSASGSDGDSDSDASADDIGNNGAICACSEENGNVPQKDTTSEPDKYSSPVAHRIGTKHLIEKLLLQETFSREECIKLTKIIESRVADFPAAKEPHHEGPSYQRYSGTKSWSRLSPPSRVHTPDVCGMAVMEAKKWVQEKSLEKSRTLELDHGPCTSNTTASYDDHAEVGSPVDVARSYMSSRPPWASPSLFNFGFRTPPSARSFYSNNQTRFSMANRLLTSSKDTHDGFQQVCLQLMEDSPEPRALARIDNSSKTQEEGTTILSHVNVNSARPEDISGELCTRVPAHGDCENVVHSHDEVASGQNKLVSILEDGKASNLNFDKVTLRTKEADDANKLEQRVFSYENGTLSCNAAVLDSDKNEDLTKVLKTDEDVRQDNLHDSLAQNVILVQHNGDASADRVHESVRMPDVNTSLPSLPAGRGFPLPEPINNGSHKSSSSYNHGIVAVSSSKGSRDFPSEASPEVVGETSAIEAESNAGESRDATEARRKSTRKRKVGVRGGRVRKK